MNRENMLSDRCKSQKDPVLPRDCPEEGRLETEVGCGPGEVGGGGADGQGVTDVLKLAVVRLYNCGCAKSPELLAFTGTYYGCELYFQRLQF